MEPKIQKRVVAWRDREHLFTPSNITKYEQACCRDCIYRKCSIKRSVRPLPNGPVIWIMRDGKAIDLTLEVNEDEMIERGSQLPEDRSGEPDQFHW